MGWERGLGFIRGISGGLGTVVYSFHSASSVLGNLFKTLSLVPIPGGLVLVGLGQSPESVFLIISLDNLEASCSHI